MPVDLVLRNGRISDSVRVDVAVESGRFVAIGEGLAYSGRREHDLQGRLLLPGLTDIHHHVDKSYTFDILGGGDGRDNAVDLVMKHKPHVTVEDIYTRARSLLERVIRHGTCALRTHIDLDPVIGLRGVEAVLALRREYADRIRIQAVAFPRGAADLKDPAEFALVRRALEMGCDVVGGVPSVNPDPKGYIDVILGLAKQFDVLVDFHVDEKGIADVSTLAYLAEATMREGLVGMVSAGHCCTLAVVEDALADQVIGLVRQAEISISTCPMTNLFLQGGGGRVPGFRGLTRVRDLLTAGVNLCCASDNVRDPFNPYGNGDPILAALLAGLAARVGTREEQEALVGTVTTAGASAMRLRDYGLRPGCRADLVAVPCESVSRVLADLPGERTVLLNGQVIRTG